VQQLWPAVDAIPVSQLSQLFLISPDNYGRLEDQIPIDALAEPIRTARTVVELGCGYGYNFSVLRDAYPGKVWIGGEYSQNAIKLAGLLFTE